MRRGGRVREDIGGTDIGGTAAGRGAGEPAERGDPDPDVHQQPVLRQRDDRTRQRQLAPLPPAARPAGGGDALLQHGWHDVRGERAAAPPGVALVPGQEVDAERGGQRARVGAPGRERGRRRVGVRVPDRGEVGAGGGAGCRPQVRRRSLLFGLPRRAGRLAAGGRRHGRDAPVSPLIRRPGSALERVGDARSTTPCGAAVPLARGAFLPEGGEHVLQVAGALGARIVAAAGGSASRGVVGIRGAPVAAQLLVSLVPAEPVVLQAAVVEAVVVEAVVVELVVALVAAGPVLEPVVVEPAFVEPVGPVVAADLVVPELLVVEAVLPVGFLGA
ncbi:hypothetical protein BJF90_11415 [Pseudonocardia sp. CNS-004]|nr:hypothetical protein BJF90_11415 [Pseudonocardia sp. CNS-004]